MDNHLKIVESTKDYAVVKFFDAESELEQFSEVSVKWLRIFEDENGKTIYKCWWPPSHMNVTSLIGKNSDHDPATWTLLNVEVDKFCSTHSSARKRAADGNYSSTDNENLGRGNRTRIPKNLSTEDERETISRNAKRQKLRHISSNIQNNRSDSDDDEINSIIDGLPEEPEFCGEKSSKLPVLKNNFEIHVENKSEHKDIVSDNFGKLQPTFMKITRECAQMRLQLKDLKNRVSILEQRNNDKSIYHELEDIKALLPLRKVRHVDEFNKTLKNSQETKLLFEKYVVQIGGASTKENVYNVLKNVFTSKCCKNFTWKGIKGKPAASKLRLMNIIRTVVCSLHSSLKVADFDTFAAEWFRVSIQRFKREKAKKAKNLQVEEQMEA